jgi:F-type H+-transporting ATPase subunit epsilon
MHVDIVTPLGEQYAGQAQELIAVGTLGEFGVMARHRDLCVSLGTGVCRIKRENGDVDRILLDEGYLQVSRGERVIIVTEHAERKEDIDAAKTREDHEAAKAELDAARESIGKTSWQVKKHALSLAEARLRMLQT